MVSDYAANRRALLRSITRAIEEAAARGALGIVNYVACWYRPCSNYDVDGIAAELPEPAAHDSH